MPPMKQLRLWHAAAGTTAIAAWLTEGAEPVHQWLGYGLVALLFIRLLMAALGAGPLGLQRFYPRFTDLKLSTAATHPAISRTLLLGIAISLLSVTATGILMDRGQSLPFVSAAAPDKGGSEGLPTTATKDHRPSFDDEDGEAHDEERKEGREGHEEDPLEEVHELFANLLIALVALHVSYLVLFKWPLARFMLFLRQSRGPSGASGRSQRVADWSSSASHSRSCSSN